ncbi:hybrid sensor histidine kinase/response regulator [Patescibacteria group bacterium]|nr:hybrid sensor histidine kinase/response regulator [Patescibacteria group bacterium]
MIINFILYYGNYLIILFLLIIIFVCILYYIKNIPYEGKIFIFKKNKYKKFKEEISKLNYYTTESELNKKIKEVLNILEIEDIKLFLLDSNNKKYVLSLYTKNKKEYKIDNLIKYLKYNKEILTENNLNKKNKRNKKLYKKILSDFKKTKSKVIVPLFFNRSFIGFFCLGEKYGKYNKIDLKALEDFREKISIALHNLHLYNKINNQKNTLDKFKKYLENKINEQTKYIEGKNKNLEELLEMKSDFLRIANHQLNTPISIVKNSLFMLQEGLMKKDKALNIAFSGIERLNDVITEFWDIFELEGGNYELKLDCVDIIKILDEQVKEKKFLIDKNKKIKLIFENNIDNNTLILCDYKKIINVISNLLDNSIRYTDKGYIKISLTKNKRKIKGKNYIKIEVEDTGIGILKKDKSKIFKKFIRGGNAIKLKPSGSGLGLYLSKKIIEMHNSKLKLEKTSKKGSKFSFKLEICDEDTISSLSNIINKKNIETKTKIKNVKILFFQNDKKTINTCSNIIKNNNYEYYYTNKLGEAKKIISEKKPNIIFSGIIIYKEDKNKMVNTIAEQGYSLLEYKNNKKINIPFIFLTNLNTTGDRKKALDMGASEYISKIEFKPENLEEIINRNLRCLIEK